MISLGRILPANPAIRFGERFRMQGPGDLKLAAASSTGAGLGASGDLTESTGSTSIGGGTTMISSSQNTFMAASALGTVGTTAPAAAAWSIANPVSGGTALITGGSAMSTGGAVLEGAGDLLLPS